MSINVEIIGGSLMVQHYVETLARKDHLILDSTSDVFTPTGRTTIHVTWELSVRELGDGRCEFTNHVHSYGTEEFMTFLDRQGIPFEQFRAQRQPASDRSPNSLLVEVDRKPQAARPDGAFGPKIDVGVRANLASGTY